MSTLLTMSCSALQLLIAQVAEKAAHETFQASKERITKELAKAPAMAEVACFAQQLITRSEH